MGIAYSKLPVFSGTIRSDTSAHLRADLDAALLSVGWVHAATVTDGNKYEITSPQSPGNLKARVLVQDRGDVNFLGAPYLVVQFMSQDETALGIEHRLIWGAVGYSTGYQVIAGRSQLFIALPGIGARQQVAVGDFSYSVAGGIPFVPAPVGDSCTVGLDSPAVTDIWWSCGSGHQVFACAYDFRNSPVCFADFSHSLNKAVVNQAAFVSGTDQSQGMLTLFYLTPTLNIDTITYPAQQILKYSTLNPINLDALIGWEWAIRAQLWDAFQRSKAETLDAIQHYVDEDDAGGTVNLTCKVWMSSYYSSLLLMTVSPPQTSGNWNVAY